MTPIDIDNRLEPFVDDYLIDTMTGVQLRLHQPTPREVVMIHDTPWEGSNSMFHTVLHDGERYVMYYGGRHMDLSDDKLTFPHPHVTCVAFSDDGITWNRPSLGIIEYEGSTANNIVWRGLGNESFSPVVDLNPACPAEARFKAIASNPCADRDDPKHGLYAAQSADGVHWSLMHDGPVIADGAFDSQNIAFWDTQRGQYRAYFREFNEGRDIATATSDDFVHWSPTKLIDYVDGRKTELYTNQIMLYPRAPHLMVGFPTRYIPGRGHLTPLNEKLSRSGERYGTDYTDGGFMTSRDGQTFRMRGEAFLRPGPIMAGRWLYGGNYQNWGLVETKMEPTPVGVAPYLHSPDTTEWSLYATQAGWVGQAMELRRYTMRLDGFASLHAGEAPGEVVTKSLKFSGSTLRLNFATSASGSVQVAMERPDGSAIRGHTLNDCPMIFGDAIGQIVRWGDSSDVAHLADQSIRLRLRLQDADMYALQFA